jgi:hemerythrin superfamily protein
MKKKAAKRPNGGAPLRGVENPAAKVGEALATTASFAAGVVRETGERIRNLASTITKSTDAGKAPGATDLLVHQHRLVEELFDRLQAPNRGFDRTLAELADDLSAHIAIEEQLFYPAVRKANPELILQGLEEHAMGRFALRRLLATRASEKSLKARMKALKELMTNHHQEEEQDLFPKVRRLMSDVALQKLGQRMQTLFEANKKRGHEAVLATFDDDLRKPVRARSEPRRR